MLFWNRWNQESAGRVYFNISREKPAHTPDTPHVQSLSCKLEWTNQKRFYTCFLLKPIRDNLAPGFPRALDLSPLHAQKSSGSRLPSTQIRYNLTGMRKSAGPPWFPRIFPGSSAFSQHFTHVSGWDVKLKQGAVGAYTWASL